MYIYYESLKQGSFFTVIKPSEYDIVYFVLDERMILSSTNKIFTTLEFFYGYKGKVWLLNV